MSLLNVNAVEPSTGTDITLGASGDTITVPSGATFTQSGTMNASAITAGTVATARLPALGKVLQVVNTETGAVATGTTLIPYDDTIPQITEGFEVMTLAVTPASATNKLLISVVTCLSSDVNSLPVTALFEGTTANALACVFTHAYGTADNPLLHNFNHYMTSGSTSELTFRVRIGTNNAGTMTFNGRLEARKYGGALASSITIMEIGV